jgi:uncharacterized small protein (DUF1192 family)
MATYPPEPPGDFEALKASIARLVALQTKVREAIVRPTNRVNSYDWDLGKAGKKFEHRVEDALAKGKQAVDELDDFIAVLKEECKRVDAAKHQWQAQCRSIDRAEQQR